MKNKKCYVLTISKTFPADHPQAGKPTLFEEKIRSGKKIHTIRLNYEFWKPRIDKIQEDLAYLSVRQWTGRAYKSKQKELFRFGAGSGIGLEKLQITPLGWIVNEAQPAFKSSNFAKNDGLELPDFYAWFRGIISIDMDPAAIIHFTNFRYS